jgi:hypothetical protein
MLRRCRLTINGLVVQLIRVMAFGTYTCPTALNVRQHGACTGRFGKLLPDRFEWPWKIDETQSEALTPSH